MGKIIHVSPRAHLEEVVVTPLKEGGREGEEEEVVLLLLLHASWISETRGY